MMQHSRQLLITLVLACAASAGFTTSPLLAQEPAPAAEEREPGPADLKEAIEIAEKHTGGKMAGAETVRREGRMVHEIRILLDDGGRVRTVRIDPATGAIIPQERAER
jgi:uncharacterized membrane protein YkoI